MFGVIEKCFNVQALSKIFVMGSEPNFYKWVNELFKLNSWIVGSFDFANPLIVEPNM